MHIEMLLFKEGLSEFKFAFAKHIFGREDLTNEKDLICQKWLSIRVSRCSQQSLFLYKEK